MASKQSNRGPVQEKSSASTSSAGDSCSMYYKAPAFVLVKKDVMRSFQTNRVRCMGCVSYYPSEQPSSDRPPISVPKMYVMRVITDVDARSKSSSSARSSGTPIATVDVYVYSDPMKFKYHTLATRAVSLEDNVVHYSSLYPSHLEPQRDVLSTEEYDTFLSTMEDFHIHSMESQPVDRTGHRCGGHIPDSMYVTRDVWDLVSVFYGELKEKAMENESGNVTHLIPLCFSKVMVSGFVYLVRLQSIPGNRFYDADVYSCEWNNVLKLLSLTEVISKYVRQTKH